MTNPSQSPYPQGQPAQQHEPNSQPKSKTGLIVGIVVAVLVIGGIIALVIALTGKDDSKPAAAPSTSASASTSQASTSATGQSSTGQPPSSQSSSGSTGGSPLGIGKATPDELVASFVSTYNAGDMKGNGLNYCGGNPLLPPGGHLELNGSPEINGDSGTARMTLTSPQNKSFPGILQLVKKDTYWCVDKTTEG